MQETDSESMKQALRQWLCVFPLGCMLMNCLLTMTYANSSGLVAHTSPEPMCLHQRIDPLTSSANSFSVMIYSCASDSSRLNGLLWYLASSLKRDKSPKVSE